MLRGGANSLFLTIGSMVWYVSRVSLDTPMNNIYKVLPRLFAILVMKINLALCEFLPSLAVNCVAQ